MSHLSFLILAESGRRAVFGESAPENSTSRLVDSTDSVDVSVLPFFVGRV